MKLDLCTVLLMDDSRYNWLVLVPRRVSRLHIPWKAASKRCSVGAFCFGWQPLRIIFTCLDAARSGRSRRSAPRAAAGAVGGSGSCSGCRAAAARRAEAQHCSNRCVYASAALVRMHPRTCGIHTLVVVHCREHLQPAARACDGEVSRRCCVARPSKCCWCRGYSTSHTRGTQCLPVRNCTTTFSLLCRAVLWCWHCGAIQGGAVAAVDQPAEVSNTTTALFFEQAQPKTCLKRC